DAGSPKSAGGPESGIGMPTLIGFWASAPSGTARAAASRTMSSVRRCMKASLVIRRRETRDRSADAIERRRGRDEQRAVVVVAPGEVGSVLGGVDDLEQPGV